MVIFKEKKSLNAESRKILKENDKIQSNYMFFTQGHEFIGFPNVLSPELSPSTSIWKKLPISRNESFLEIGCGTGVFSILAAKQGASKVLGTDINPDAVKNTLANATLHGVNHIVESMVSDVFNDISTNNCYDVILWNIPWSHTEQKNLSILEKAKFDPGFILLERYLSGAKSYLKPDGRLLLGYSSTYGEIPVLIELSQKYNWNLKMLYQVGSLSTFFAEMYELTPKPIF